MKRRVLLLSAAAAIGIGAMATVAGGAPATPEEPARPPIDAWLARGDISPAVRERLADRVVTPREVESSFAEFAACVKSAVGVDLTFSWDKSGGFTYRGPVASSGRAAMSEAIGGCEQVHLAAVDMSYAYQNRLPKAERVRRQGLFVSCLRDKGYVARNWNEIADTNPVDEARCAEESGLGG